MSPTKLFAPLAPSRHVTPSASIVHVTPDMASKWLERNPRNRPVKKNNVARFARDMANGNWQVTGEAIKFDQEENLLDGQNRLNAVIVARTTVPFFVVNGLATESQQVMDSGTVRSAADALHLRGIAAAKDVAPAASTLIGWHSGYYAHCMTNRNPDLTKTEICEYVEAHPELEQMVSWIIPVRRQLPVGIGPLAAAGCRFSEIDTDATIEFFDRVRELRTQGKGDPVNTLLKRVSDDKLAGKRIHTSIALFYLARAWNAYRTGERLEKFQLGSENRGWGKIPEPK